MHVVVGLSSGRGIAVRALTGREEALVAEMRPPSPAAWGNAVLSFAAADPGSGEPIGRDAVRRLSLGDRERLLLAVYVATFGAADLVARCQGCGETVEVELDLAGFLAEAERRGRFSEAIDIAIEGDAPSLRGRLPLAGDLEEIAALAASDPSGAAEELLDRCLRTAGGPGAPNLTPERRDVARAALARAVEERDPDAEISVAMTCPNCARAHDALLDAATLLRGRGLAGDQIFVEVDRLARIYHWNEADILDLPRSRRLRYLALAGEHGA
ncbi:hypothetical protein [Hansschlegelia zhihuaiae]|uniref:Uncharacterized protein n=1 Tax=Hansschlegelia zhihuaiae TaxID=405005 RepID=A0A4Q0MKZ3_9HYPH|nr:hypothetical protein [Hansschlegelia zhihuaiae]RXF74133.1 hypothetical protein EK403_07105 [Hansschlegelia zhihuaiae]